MELEECYGPCDGSDTLLVLSALAGVCGIVSIYVGGVSSNSFGEIASLPQTNMAWLVCVFCKELKNHEIV